MTLLKNAHYQKENLKRFLELKMKNRVLLYKNFKGGLRVIFVEKPPFWKRIFYRKKFDVKLYSYKS